MPRFINIAAKGQNPVQLNVDNISAITELKNQGYGQNETHLSISSRSFANQRNILLGSKSWGVDPDECIAALKAAGLDLIELPYSFGDQKDLGRIFVNPDAFIYIATGQPYTPKDKTEPHTHVLMGLDGEGIETMPIPVKAVEDLMAAVAHKKPNLKRLEPSKANAHFYQSGFSAYDPEKIIAITTNADRINARFASGGSVDFIMPRRDWGNEYLNKKYNHVKDAAKRATFEQKNFEQTTGSTSDPGKLFFKLQNFSKNMEKRVCREFARAAAKDAPQLLQVRSDQPVYLRTDNLTMISLYEETERETKYAQLTFHFVKGTADTSPYGEGQRAYFKTRSDAEKELARLNNILAAPKP